MSGRRRTARLRGAERQAWVREVLRRWKSSPLSPREFCRAEGIAPVTLYRWRREVFGGEAETRGTSFVRVELPRATTPFELELDSGARVRVPPGFDAEDLTRLLAVLEERRC